MVVGVKIKKLSGSRETHIPALDPDIQTRAITWWAAHSTATSQYHLMDSAASKQYGITSHGQDFRQSHDARTTGITQDYEISEKPQVFNRLEVFAADPQLPGRHGLAHSHRESPTPHDGIHSTPDLAELLADTSCPGGCVEVLKEKEDSA